MEEAERMERRERDKLERAKMSLIQNHEPEPEMPCLFSAVPFRVSLIKCVRLHTAYNLKTRTICRFIKKNNSNLYSQSLEDESH